MKGVGAGRSALSAAASGGMMSGGAMGSVLLAVIVLGVGSMVHGAFAPNSKSRGFHDQRC